VAALGVSIDVCQFLSADIAIASALLVRPLTKEKDKEKEKTLSQKLERFEDLQIPGLQQCSAVLGSARQCSAVLGKPGQVPTSSDKPGQAQRSPDEPRQT